MSPERYAVVSCHVERPLDDRVWAAFARFQARRPAGFSIAALMRPPDPDAGEPEAAWLERARVAAVHGPLGHHTHWGGETQARPVSGEPAERVRREADWLRSQGLEPRFFCGGGWYMDAGVASVLAGHGYVDTTATSYRLPYLAPGAPHVSVGRPAWLRLDDGGRLLELPATHSVGMLVRGLLGSLPPIVHVHFHDWDLVDPRRRRGLELGLRLLRLRRRPLDLGTAAELAAAEAPETPFSQAAGIESSVCDKQAPLAGPSDG